LCHHIDTEDPEGPKGESKDQAKGPNQKAKSILLTTREEKEKGKPQLIGLPKGQWRGRRGGVKRNECRSRKTWTAEDQPEKPDGGGTVDARKLEARPDVQSGGFRRSAQPGKGRRKHIERIGEVRKTKG